MNRKIFLGALILTIVLTSFFGGISMAGTTEFPFSVTAVIPDNQVAEEHTFFNLLMSPVQHQILEMSLRNHTTEEIVLIPRIAVATTSNDGVVEYNPDISPTSTLRPDITEIVSAIDEQVTIPALGYTIMHLEVQMPVEDFEGVIAGGLVLETINENPYTFIMGIILRTDIEEVEPDLELSDVFVEAAVDNQYVIKVTISNIMPRFMNQVTVHTNITRRDEIIHQETKAELQMAPNSRMDYMIVSIDELGTGNYTLEITVESGGEEWNWVREINVSTGGVIEVADELSEDTRCSNPAILIVMILLVIIVLVFVTIRTVMIRRQKAENKKVAEILQSVERTRQDFEEDDYN